MLQNNTEKLFRLSFHLSEEIISNKTTCRTYNFKNYLIRTTKKNKSQKNSEPVQSFLWRLSFTITALTRFFLKSIIDNILYALFSFFSKTVTIYRKGWFSLCFICFQLCYKFQEPWSIFKKPLALYSVRWKIGTQQFRAKHTGVVVARCRSDKMGKVKDDKTILYLK